MPDSYLLSLEQRIRTLLTVPGHSLSESSKDQCSEVSRLLGHWMLEEEASLSVFILKGVGVSGDPEKAHELLMVKKNLVLIFIDPTVWQFFPSAKSIFLESIIDENQGKELLTVMYGGNWELVEEIFYDKEEKIFLEQTIRENMKEYFL